MRNVLCTALLAIIVTAATTSLLAQTVSSTPPRTRLGDYIAKLMAHAPGAQDESIRALKMESTIRVRSRIKELADIQRGRSQALGRGAPRQPSRELLVVVWGLALFLPFPSNMERLVVAWSGNRFAVVWC